MLRATSQQATGLYKIHYNATHSYVPRSVTFLYSEPMQSTSVTVMTTTNSQPVSRSVCPNPSVLRVADDLAYHESEALI